MTPTAEFTPAKRACKLRYAPLECVSIAGGRTAFQKLTELNIAYSDFLFDNSSASEDNRDVMMTHSEPVNMWGLEPCGDMLSPIQSRPQAGTVAARRPRPGAGGGIFEVKRR